MPTRHLTAKEESAIEYYCDSLSDTYNNWAQSCLRAGYSECKGWEANARRVRTKDTVVAGIEAFKVKMGTKTARTVQSVDELYEEARLLAIKIKQPSAAVSAITGIARLYGMDRQVINDDREEERELSEVEEKLIADFNRQYKIRVARETG